MMALKLATLKPDTQLQKTLSKRLVADWPAVKSQQVSHHKGSHRKAGYKSHHKKLPPPNAAGIASGSCAMQVGDMSLNIAEGDEARLQLRYEVERVLDTRGQQYLIKWKHLPLEDATWERASSELLTTAAAKVLSPP